MYFGIPGEGQPTPHYQLEGLGGKLPQMLCSFSILVYRV